MNGQGEQGSHDGQDASAARTARQAFAHARRVVVKIGSAVLAPGGELSLPRLEALCAQIHAARQRGVEITVVSSGAIACGFRVLGLDAPPTTIVQKQAAAAAGQLRLMLAWEKAAERHGVKVAQVLLVSDDFVDRTRYLNARRVLGELHERGLLAVINENDTVSYDEIRFGDNDALAAHVAGLVGADLLLVLSTAKGLYAHGDASKVIAHVEMDGGSNAAALSQHVTKDKTVTGVGGMASKLHAMGVASALGVHSVIAGGTEPNVITRVLAGEVLGTHFSPAPDAPGAAVGSRRDAWILAGVRVAGRLTVDAGACAAILRRGASLLPSGVTKVEGRFARGATLDVLDEAGELIARGLAAYSDEETRRVMGKRSGEIEATLGYALGEELIHRDDLVVMRRA